MSETFDVIEVARAEPPTVRVLATGLDELNALAIINMTAVERGVEGRFYTKAPSGVYVDGDIYTP